ncbi:hypothetical protein Hypma_012152 [Hypsizygus marmoreus]|uniref:Uncharacterized protein n=1 Tax=Hypsizygus marmoreus TaxID=39966 RepID=A0A369JJJ0_HYPMA|nr:hypothetical protein Hypma_012152 [Hypsizygus marmoreus]
MAAEFVFDHKNDYVNGSLTDTSNASLIYTFNSTYPSSKRRDEMPETTEVRNPYGKHAVIFWKERAFQLDGGRLLVDDIRTKEHDSGSTLARRWLYANKKWQVRFDSGHRTWKVFWVLNDTPEETSSVEFKPFHSNLAGKAHPATITVQSSVTEHDALFVIIVLLYSELTEHPHHFSWKKTLDLLLLDTGYSVMYGTSIDSAVVAAR